MGLTGSLLRIVGLSYQRSRCRGIPMDILYYWGGTVYAGVIEGVPESSAVAYLG